MNNLGALYDNGHGVAVNTRLAGKWLSEAVGRGHEFTKDRLIDKPDTYERGTRKAIQQRLKSAGHYKGAIDGEFGAGTVAALNAFFRNPEVVLRLSREVSGRPNTRHVAALRPSGTATPP